MTSVKIEEPIVKSEEAPAKDAEAPVKSESEAVVQREGEAAVVKTEESLPVKTESEEADPSSVPEREKLVNSSSPEGEETADSNAPEGEKGVDSNEREGQKATGDTADTRGERRSSSSGRTDQKPRAADTERARGPLNERFKFFLANLPPSVTSAEMRRHFEAFGGVNYVKLIYNKVTGISMGYGFLYLMDEETDRRVEEYAQRNNFRIRFANFSRIYLQRNDRARAKPLRFKSSHEDSQGRHHDGAARDRQYGPPRGGDFGRYGHQGGRGPPRQGDGGGMGYYGRNDYQEGPPPQQYPQGDRGQHDGPRGPRGGNHYGGGPPQGDQYHGRGPPHQNQQNGRNGGVPPNLYQDGSYSQQPVGYYGGEGGFQGHQSYPEQQPGNWENGYADGGNFAQNPAQRGPPSHQEDGYYQNAPPSNGHSNYPTQNAYSNYPQGGEQGHPAGDYGYSQVGPPSQQGYGGQYGNDQEYGYSQAPQAAGPHGYSNGNPEAFPSGNTAEGGYQGDYQPGAGYDDQRNYNQGYGDNYQQGQPDGGNQYPPADASKGYYENQAHPQQGGPAEGSRQPPAQYSHGGQGRGGGGAGNGPRYQRRDRPY